MVEWISVLDRLPLAATKGQSFQTMEVLVSDGKSVTHTDFRIGGLPEPWGEFDPYCNIPRTQITHWMPLPEPPK